MTDTGSGVTVNETTLEFDKVAVPLTPASVAVIVAVPLPTIVARPWLPGALLMVATAGSEELQATAVVKLCGVPVE